MNTDQCAEPTLTQQEKHRLMSYLAQPERSENCLQYDDVLGFICGVCCAPDMVMPQEWMATLFDQEELEFTDVDNPALIIDPLMKIYNQCMDELMRGEFHLPAEYAILTEDDLREALSSWIDGFLLAFDWLEQSWSESVADLPEIEAEGEVIATEEALMTSLSMLALYLEPDSWEEAEVDETAFTSERLQEYVVTVGSIGQILYQALAAEAANDDEETD
jgi:uncharacterized protein